MKGDKTMNQKQLIAIIIIILFYSAYFGKMLLQRKKGITTNQMGKGVKEKQTLRVERLLTIATYSIVPIELVSIFYNKHRFLDGAIAYIGLGIAFTGVLIFIIAMWTMRDSWRAGIPKKDETKIVTAGIYRFSRNPAFLGFDMMYIGIFIAFDNAILFMATIFVITMMHLQIIEEEKFLYETFGQTYLDYKAKTRRYL